VRDDAGTDRWIRDAITSAAATNGISYLAAIASQNPDSTAREGDRLPAGTSEITAIVSQHIARGEPSREETEELLAILTTVHPVLGQSIIHGLRDGWPESHHVSISDSRACQLGESLSTYPVAARVDLIGLLAMWSVAEVPGFESAIADSLRPILFDESLPDAERVAASELWIRATPTKDSAVEEVLSAVTPQASVELARGMIEAVATSRAAQLGTLLVDLHPNLTPATRGTAIDVLLRRPAMSETLLAAIEAGTIRVSGWGYPAHQEKSVSLIVRLHYDEGATEDHPLRNGIHFADYIRRVDVPESEFAFALRSQQIRYLAVQPKRPEAIKTIEFIKGDDPTAPMILAVTVECQ
jgi:hypothetical protein